MLWPYKRIFVNTEAPNSLPFTLVGFFWIISLGTQLGLVKKNLQAQNLGLSDFLCRVVGDLVEPGRGHFVLLKSVLCYN